MIDYISGGRRVRRAARKTLWQKLGTSAFGASGFLSGNAACVAASRSLAGRALALTA